MPQWSCFLAGAKGPSFGLLEKGSLFWFWKAQKQVKKLGSPLARHTGQPDGEATAHLWQRLGVLLQRGNANLFSNRIPNHPEPQVDGLL